MGYSNATPSRDAYGLWTPDAIYVMPNGDFYVMDMNNYRIQHYRNGSRLGQTVAGNGTGGSDPSQLGQSQGIYVDQSTSGVYIADTGNYRIQLWKANAT